MGQLQEVLIVVVCLFGGTCGSARSPGHMMPLGEHASPKGVTLIGKFSSPGVFYQQFVKTSKPLHMKNVLQLAEFPPLHKWNKKYFREKIGTDIVSVEPRKKENRSMRKVLMTVNDFLDRYMKENLYLVSPLPEKLKEDLYLPASLTCGGLERSLMEVGLWYSGGGTASVLHQDQLDNIICVLNGTKDIVLIDKAYKNLVESHGFHAEGSYSDVDVDAVDGDKFPHLLMVPWHSMHLDPGDCGYVPYKWYHQVRSSGRGSIAVNFWFTHLWWLDQDSCFKQVEANMDSPLPPYANPNEALRCALLEPFSSLNEVYAEDLEEVFSHCELSVLQKFFKYIDADSDDELSWPELYRFNVDEAAIKFPTLFASINSQPSSTKASRKSEPPPLPAQPQTVQNTSEEIVIKVPIILDEDWDQLTSSSDAEGKEDLPGSADENSKSESQGVEPEEDLGQSKEAVDSSRVESAAEDESSDRSDAETPHPHDEF